MSKMLFWIKSNRINKKGLAPLMENSLKLPPFSQTKLTL
jgi:hypothetical protein